MLTGVPAGVPQDTWEEGYPSTQKCGAQIACSSREMGGVNIPCN